MFCADHYQGGNEAEINNLKHNGTGKDGDSQWVMSVVPVAKKDGVHHSGGDYKVTVSPVLESRLALLTQT